jgi:hypothetical protein
MFIKTATWFSIMAVGAMLILAAPGKTASQSELDILRESFFILQKRLLDNYLQELLKLPINSEVTAEISTITAEIGKLTKAAPAPDPAAVVVAAPKPAPKPVIKKRAAITQVSEVEGWAGAASFSKNNVYTFYLPDVGTYSTMKFWATGRRSIDSTGNVWLVTPAGHREKISKWKDRDFEEPATEISSYKKIAPIIVDISELVTKAGTYKIEFEWTGGIDPLVIYRVELTS